MHVSDRPALIVFVNGYGVPDDIIADRNYQLYFGAIRAYIMAVTQQGDTVRMYLSGGATDLRRPQLTEAGEMRRYLAYIVEEAGCFADRKLNVRCIEDAIDTREGLCSLQKEVGRHEVVVIFCEWTRQDRVRMFAGLLFSKARVVPIPFAHISVLRRLREVPRTILARLAWHSDALRHLELAFRHDYLARMAADEPWR